jgi:hypothetical protein
MSNFHFTVFRTLRLVDLATALAAQGWRLRWDTRRRCLVVEVTL